MKYVFIASALVLGPNLCAQVTANPDTSVRMQRGWITVQAGPQRADVFVDSVFLGKSPIEKAAIPAGKHLLKLFFPDVMAWDRAAWADSFTVAPGEEVRKTIDPQVRVKLNSIPYGATVFQDGKELGVTPLSLVFAGVGQRRFLIRKEGYQESEINSADMTTPSRIVQLAPLAGPEDIRGDIILGNINKTEHWYTVVSGATMIVSGILSAYLKDKANREFDRYLESQNIDFLNSTNSLDRQASTAFILTQISFGVLIYLLLSD